MTDTGDAAAASGGMAVTGYRDSASGADTARAAPVRVSGTGGATASGGGLANTGYIHQVRAEHLTMVQQRTPREPAAWPHQVGVIPPRAQSFQYRAEAEELRAAMRGGGTAEHRRTPAGTYLPVRVLAGMGGVGKTQLAADYARTAWADGGLDLLVWITASARSSVLTGYAQAGVELCRADLDDPEQAARTFLAWLTPKAAARPCRWLIVLDDVADPGDLHGLWPPASPYGRPLVTTRRRDAALVGEGRRRIEVGLFSEAEAVGCLTTSLAAHGRHEPADQLTALAADLGHLPLALSQAAAYLIDSGEDAAAYRELLADRATALADTVPDALPDDQALPLAATWSLSIDRADDLRPAGLARPMLELASLLDANGIPKDVLTSRPALAHLTAHRTRAHTHTRAHTRTRIGPHPAGKTAPVSARDAERTLSVLHRLSLIDHSPATPHQAVRVHQLIQRATRDTLTAHRHDQTARTAADALIAVWPAVERDTALAEALRTNTAALAACADEALHRSGVHPVLFRWGTSLGESGRVAAATTYFRRLSATTGRRLGSDHPNTLAARGALAEWRGEAGDPAAAAESYAELLADSVRVLGRDHPDTLAVRRDLADWRGMAGDATGAADALASLVPLVTRVLGPDHPAALATRRSAASWQGTAGDAAGAATAYGRLLADTLRVLGADHPATLTTRHNHAHWQGLAGDAAGAADEYVQLLHARMRVLGPEHPSTLWTWHDVAWWRGEAGDPTSAAHTLTDVVAACRRVLGPDHPFTFTSRLTQAHWRGLAGDASGAADSIAELLPDMARVLGPDHRDIRTARDQLARWRSQAAEQSGHTTPPG
ncbi:tetratricopeptide repeat protein [Streptomyces asiaticus]|uniref:tetratricopeptide repeat protein n=1 Tax=Streptomyces asiaticus TaxID=114695 RepID=UPI00382A22E9